MVKWETIRVKLTSDEKEFLVALKKEYQMSYNQTFRRSLEFLLRFFVIAEYHNQSKIKTLRIVKKISEKNAKILESQIKEALKKIPKEQQKKDNEQYVGEITQIYGRFAEIFVTNRKLGRPPLVRKRGRPKDTGKTS